MKTPALPACQDPARPDSVARSHESGAAAPLAVAIHAEDSITGQAVAVFLAGRPEVAVLPSDQWHEAEAALVLAGRVTEDTIAAVERIADAAVREDVVFVLVGEGVLEHHVTRAVSCGLVSVIPRRDADLEQIVLALADVRRGRLRLPGELQSWLVTRLRTIERDVLEPNGLTATGLEQREVDVLRLLAEGLGTLEIGQRLNYAERTVKYIIHGMLTRKQLRNRTHAVAYAARHGLL